MAENFQNFYVTRLREACDASATTIYVDTIPTITEGTLVIEYTNSTKREIIHFTGRSGYSLTGCTRGYEGTTAQSHSAGVDVRQNVTAGMMDAITNRAIHTENIADEAVTTAKIDDEAITTEKIEDEAVTSDKIDWTTLPAQSDGWIETKLTKDLSIFVMDRNIGTIAIGPNSWGQYSYGSSFGDGVLIGGAADVWYGDAAGTVVASLSSNGSINWHIKNYTSASLSAGMKIQAIALVRKN